MLAQLVEDLLHLERGRQGLDEHGGADGPARDAESLLGPDEHVVPEPGLEVVLELGQVEVRATTQLDQAVGVVEEVQAEVRQAARRRAALAGAIGHPQVLLRQVPPAGAHDDRRRRRPHAVLLALRRDEVDLPPERVEQAVLTTDDVRPGR